MTSSRLKVLIRKRGWIEDEPWQVATYIRVAGGPMFPVRIGNAATWAGAALLAKELWEAGE